MIASKWTDPFGIRQFLQFLGETRGPYFVTFIKHMFEQRGNFLVTKTFGMDNIITCDPEIIKTVLATSFKDWSVGLRRQAMFPVLGNAIFSVEGEQWSHSRAMLRPQFTKDSISHTHVLEEHVSRLIDRFNSFEGRPFECQKHFFEFTLDSASQFLFGESTDCLLDGKGNSELLNEKGDNADNFAKVFAVSFAFATIRLRLQQMYFLLPDWKYRKSIDRLHRFVDTYVDRAFEQVEKLEEKKDEQDDSDRYVISRELAKVCKDRKYIRDQLLGILLAGRNTTAAVLGWILYECGRNSEIWKKLQEDVLENFGDFEDFDSSNPASNLTYDEIKRCTYVRYVINEALRMYPSVPMNQRVAVKDTFLPKGGGKDGSLPLFCPKGTKVAYSVYALHMRKDFYGDDPEVFRPERWAEGVGKSWEYLPFNGGPRICLGQQFALVEASYTLIRLVQSFDSVELAMEVQTPEPKRSPFSMVHRDGIIVKLVRSESN